MFPTTRRSVIAALASEDAEQRRRAVRYRLSRCIGSRFTSTCGLCAGGRGCGRRGFDAGISGECFENGSLTSYDASKASFRTFLRMLFDRSRRERVEGILAAEMWLRVSARLDFDNAETEIAREHDRGGSHRRITFSANGPGVSSVSPSNGCATKRDATALRSSSKPTTSMIRTRATYRETGERFGVNATSATNSMAAMRAGGFRAIVLDVLREATASEAGVSRRGAPRCWEWTRDVVLGRRCRAFARRRGAAGFQPHALSHRARYRARRDGRRLRSRRRRIAAPRRDQGARDASWPRSPP